MAEWGRHPPLPQSPQSMRRIMELISAKMREKKKYSIPIYENGIKTEYVVEFEEGDEKYQLLIKLTGKIPTMINVNVKK